MDWIDYPTRGGIGYWNELVTYVPSAHWFTGKHGLLVLSCFKNINTAAFTGPPLAADGRQQQTNSFGSLTVAFQGSVRQSSGF